MNRISETIRDRLAEQPLIYVTRDIERALGMEPEDGYFVISNDTEYGREVREKSPENIRLVKGDSGLLDTYDLLALPKAQEIIAERSANILVFQNNPRIERLAKEEGWSLLNPSADLSREIEEKISQAKWLSDDAKLLPPHVITAVKDVAFSGKRFVLQFNHSHTGEGTHIIDSEEKLQALQNKFPFRECRVTDFIEGPVFTLNCAVTMNSIAAGNISYQITGLHPFTDNAFATVGNDFGLPRRILSDGEREKIREIARRVGSRLKASGWKGLFGIDVIQDKSTGAIYLLEINARQPASTTFESRLQKTIDPEGASIFEAHIASLLGIRDAVEPTTIESGAQIVLRNTEAARGVDIPSLKAAVEARGLKAIAYDAPSPGKELLRIQTKDSLMREHGIFGDLGEAVRDIIVKQ